MTQYDFKVLQFNEFECLCRDLLQKDLGVRIECFTDGRDQGIDLRHTWDDDKTLIVQVKRYQKYSTLLSNLKKEVVKVNKLAPARYIIATSVELTPQNKQKILQLFSPFIKGTCGIYGKDDLNNLLGQYPEIEKSHYKLWLTSTNVLERILHSHVYNWSALELETIEEQVGSYVANKSLEHALDIIDKYRYVIISGTPGIGKTTLARVLVYHILGQGYKEFVYMANGVNDAMAVYKKDVKQVFFYDDFLGSVTLDTSKSNFDALLVSFIQKIQRDKNKVFIMTTREYILSDAKRIYEKFTNNNIEMAKCVLDLSYYSKTIRAQILYNHIAISRLDKEYILQLLKDDNYLKLVGHQNFTPRIIEAYIDCGRWKQYAPEQFVNKFVEFFDRPLSVWEKAFENLPENIRYALCLLASLGQRVFMEDWRNAYDEFCEQTQSKLNLRLSDLEWKQGIKILSDCFIRVNKRDEGLLVSFFNPSVIDFVLSYMAEDKKILKLIVENAKYAEQLLLPFGNTNYFCHVRTNIPEDIKPSLVSSFERIALEPQSCNLSYDIPTGKYMPKYSEIQFFLDMQRYYPEVFVDNPGLMERYITMATFDESDDINKICLLATRLDWDNMYSYNINELAQSLEDRGMDANDYAAYIPFLSEKKLKDVSDADFVSVVEETLFQEIDEATTIDELDRLDDPIRKISYMIPLSDDVRGQYDEKYNDLQEEDSDEESAIEHSVTSEMEWDNKRICEMFTSLLVAEE